MTSATAATGTRTLLAALAAQQRRVLGILDGLDETDLTRPVLPSGWSCAAMVRHLDVGTWFWLAEVMAGAPAGHVDDDFALPDGVPAARVLADYRDRMPRAADLVADLAPDTPPAWWPQGRFGGWRLDNLTEVLLHSLTETATHAGHLDAARELIDGRTWDHTRGRLTGPHPTG
jgi:hypothetical protein